MALRGRGTILHISSDAAASAYPGCGAYGVSKAAQDHLVRSFAADFERAGGQPRFLSVDPGEMDTRMHADAVPDADRSTLAAPSTVALRILRWLATAPPTGSRAADLT
jgi:NAD(P)-dependent dehydrogenase (short-subunit alcohol dehydrogenase family)